MDSQIRDYQKDYQKKVPASKTSDNLREQAKQEARNFLSQMQDQLAAGIKSVGNAIRRGGTSLQEDQLKMLGDYANQLGDRMDRLADQLRGQDAQTFIDRSTRMVRRNPEMFLGGMFIVGLGLARFLKASSSQSVAHSPTQTNRDTPTEAETVTIRNYEAGLRQEDESLSQEELDAKLRQASSL